MENKDYLKIIEDQQSEISKLKKELKKASSPSSMLFVLKNSIKREIHNFFIREDKMKEMDSQIKELKKELEKKDDEFNRKSAELIASFEFEKKEAPKNPETEPEHEPSNDTTEFPFPQTQEDAVKMFFKDVINLSELIETNCNAADKSHVPNDDTMNEQLSVPNGGTTNKDSFVPNDDTANKNLSVPNGNTANEQSSVQSSTTTNKSSPVSKNDMNNPSSISNNSTKNKKDTADDSTKNKKQKKDSNSSNNETAVKKKVITQKNGKKKAVIDKRNESKNQKEQEQNMNVSRETEIDNVLDEPYGYELIQDAELPESLPNLNMSTSDLFEGTEDWDDSDVGI